MFLYTDGLTEIFNLAGDEYGLCRAEVLASRHSARELEDMLAECLGEIGSFSAGVKRTDDLTLSGLAEITLNSKLEVGTQIQDLL